MVHLFWTSPVYFFEVISSLWFLRLMSGSFAGGKDSDSCFTHRNKLPSTYYEGHVSQYFYRTSCDDVDKLASTITFPSGKDFSIRNVFAKRCLMEGWKCDDNSVCVNVGNSFRCLCNDGYTGTGLVCVPSSSMMPATGLYTNEVSMTSDLPSSAPKMTVCPGSSLSSPVMWGQSNYCFVPEEESWDTASSECTQAGGHLAVIGNPGENEFLRSVIEERGTGSNWVGLKYGDQGWAWIDKSETYQNWGEGEGAPGANSCARIKDDTGKLHDRSCTRTYAYICEEEIV